MSGAVPDLLNHRRLRRQAVGEGPAVFAPIARAWIASVTPALARIGDAGPGELPSALHEMRSGATAVGANALAGALAAVEQRVEAGGTMSGEDLDELTRLAGRSAAALAAWWEGAGG